MKLDKPDFIGKQALEAEVAAGPKKQLVTMTIDCDVAPAHAGDSVYSTSGTADDADKVRGGITSGGYGHRVQANIAYAFVEPELATIGTTLEIGILGERYAAVVTESCLFDPENTLVRA